MWAFGCVASELISKRPLFPGNDSINQIQVIASVLGSPGPEIMDKISDEKVCLVAKFHDFNLKYT